MVKKELTLKELQRAVAIERGKAKTSQQKLSLRTELKQLRAGTSTKLLKRLGRGFVVLTKKGAKATGKGIVAARKFAEESGAGQGFDDLRFESALTGNSKSIKQRPTRIIIRRTKIIKSKPRRRRREVTTVIRTKKIIRGPKRRVPQNDGFFGGLSDLGI